LDASDGRLVEIFGLPQKNLKAKFPKPGPVVPPHEALVEDAYLRTLGRLPTDDERSTSLAHLASATDGRSGLRSLYWALVNTKEFILNH